MLFTILAMAPFLIVLSVTLAVMVFVHQPDPNVPPSTVKIVLARSFYAAGAVATAFASRVAVRWLFQCRRVLLKRYKQTIE